jgi:HTH-type transcriptional regulator/antitoxin HigA
VLSHLSKTYLDGAAFFDGTNPVIVYTGRYDRIDHFWWTLTHEIVHVLKHITSQKDCFLDNLDVIDDPLSISEQEAEADRETRRILKVSQILEKAQPFTSYFTENRLTHISQDLGLSPQVVIGILHHHKVVEWRTLAKVKKPILESIPEEYKKG